MRQGNPVDLYFLFEHKSGPERYARVQVLQYMASRWYALVREGLSGPLPMVIPVVIYHGAKTWNFSLDFTDLLHHALRVIDSLPAGVRHAGRK
ncbi:MAG: Rpn family recombination-promoting nuclease/putative transposase [Thermodesulfobacteriota bacterium]